MKSAREILILGSRKVYVGLQGSQITYVVSGIITITYYTLETGIVTKVQVDSYVQNVLLELHFLKSTLPVLMLQ
jgi:hypothetical protein